MLAFYSKKNYYFKTIFILILVIKYFIEVIYKKNKNLFEIRKLIKLNDRIVFMSWTFWLNKNNFLNLKANYFN